ncbi:eukaryotic translation initiation factor 4E binding protein-domain-containing protein [Spinellus fusiger]|nr:eukaryotic translation initiation factor 4E binding protein-domain-containing protein [Spinellus fusiger]
MSAAIPVAIRRNNLDVSLPSNYSTTPSGTIYSSTPGGTRVIYDRDTLLALSSSQLAQTPPVGMAYVAGVTRSGAPEGNAHSHRKIAEKKKEEEEKKTTYTLTTIVQINKDYA